MDEIFREGVTQYEARYDINMTSVPLILEEILVDIIIMLVEEYNLNFIIF